MRFFKLNRKLNLKYIFGEILLLFIGINLAIWFNNWNASKKINEEKKVAISKIAEEIKNNKLNRMQRLLIFRRPVAPEPGAVRIDSIW